MITTTSVIWQSLLVTRDGWLMLQALETVLVLGPPFWQTKADPRANQINSKGVTDGSLFRGTQGF